MHKHSLLTSFALSVLAALFFLGLPKTQVRAAPEPLLVIVGLKFPVKDIRLADLKTLFRGEPTVVTGKRLIPINHDLGTSARVAFDRALLGLSPDAVGRFWVDRRIRDEGSPPKSVAPELALRIVVALPNAVTYGTQAQLNPKVMAISIDGKHAGQPGYDLAQ